MSRTQSPSASRCSSPTAGRTRTSAGPRAWTCSSASWSTTRRPFRLGAGATTLRLPVAGAGAAPAAGPSGVLPTTSARPGLTPRRRALTVRLRRLRSRGGRARVHVLGRAPRGARVTVARPARRPGRDAPGPRDPARHLCGRGAPAGPPVARRHPRPCGSAGGRWSPGRPECSAALEQHRALLDVFGVGHRAGGVQHGEAMQALDDIGLARWGHPGEHARKGTGGHPDERRRHLRTARVGARRWTCVAHRSKVTPVS